MLSRISLIVLVCVYANAFSQKRNGNDTEQRQSTSVAPSYPTKVYEPRVSKRKKKKSLETTYNVRDKYYDRLEQLEKERNKTDRQLQQPQYSNQKYFGHKRPPKKRPPGKMKYCKVCGIRH